MSMKKYVIDCRHPDGTLDLTGSQPAHVFGVAAIRGITEDTMAKIIFSKSPNAVLSGTDIAKWPAWIDARWVAREKYW